jgi:hypothetical protein
MCDKCVELDNKMNHYQRLASSIDDPKTRDGIKQLVEQIEAEKAALHPEQPR